MIWSRNAIKFFLVNESGNSITLFVNFQHLELLHERPKKAWLTDDGVFQGISYHYVTKEQFVAAKANNEFIETAEFSGNMYGTSCKAVSDVQKAGQICILDIEMQGVIQLKAHPDIHPHYVFIRPPSMEELESGKRYFYSSDSWLHQILLWILLL